MKVFSKTKTRRFICRLIYKPKGSAHKRGPFLLHLSAAAAATIVAIVAVIVSATAGQNKDQNDDPPAAVTSKKAVIVAHNPGSSFRCQAQIQNLWLMLRFCFVLSTLHHIAKGQFWLQFFYEEKNSVVFVQNLTTFSNDGKKLSRMVASVNNISYNAK